MNRSVLAALDEAPTQRFHRRMVLIAGMGFFTDAYDLFIIGVVTAILTPLWHLSVTQLAILNSTSLAAAAVGALVFGRLMDRLGRRAMYGLEVAVLAGGALLSALAPSFGWLVALRAVVGLGVGGDYPASSVIMGEMANRRHRGRLVTLVFAMQGLGLLAGPVVASLLLSSHLPPALVWRLMLGLGAVPAASVVYLRRRMPESPRFLWAVRGDGQGAAQAVTALTGRTAPAPPAPVEPDPAPALSLAARPWAVRLVGAFGAWFLTDVAFYGNSVSSQLILARLMPNAALGRTVLVSALIFLVAAMPGYLAAAAAVDRWGRKPLQMVGFSVMAASYLTFWLVPQILQAVPWFLAVYGLSYFFTEFGPNTTTFLIPAEIFPTRLRGTAHGLAAAGGKLGAFTGAFFLPVLLAHFSLGPTMGLLGGISALGAGLTLVTLPEMRQRSLDELDSRGAGAEASPAPPARLRVAR